MSRSPTGKAAKVDFHAESEAASPMTTRPPRRSSPAFPAPTRRRRCSPNAAIVTRCNGRCKCRARKKAGSRHPQMAGRAAEQETPGTYAFSQKNIHRASGRLSDEDPRARVLRQDPVQATPAADRRSLHQSRRDRIRICRAAARASSTCCAAIRNSSGRTTSS